MQQSNHKDLLSDLMPKLYEPSLRQIEDWHYNYILRKTQPANAIEFKLELINPEVESLKKAYSELIRRHESLRTRFPKIDGKIRQEVIPFCSSCHKLLVFEIQTDNGDKYIERKKKEAYYRIKDLKGGCIATGMLFMKDVDKALFVFIIHHIISDHWSLNILRKELLGLYDSYKRGHGNDSSTPEFNLHDYIENQNTIFGQKQSTIINFWLNNLRNGKWQTNFGAIHAFLRKKGVNTDSLSTVHGWEKIRSKDLIRRPLGELYTICLEPDLYAKIKEFSAKTNASVFSLLLASFSLLSTKITGNEKCLIQTHFANRIDPISRHIVGNLIGKVLVPLSVSAEKSVYEYVHCTYQVFVDSISNLLLNSEKLSSLKITTRSFLFFNFIDKTMVGDKSQPILPPLRQLNQHVESPLVCFSSEYNNTITLSWFYHLGYFDFEAMTVISHEHITLLKAMVADKAQKVEKVLYRETVSGK
jgi:hypothetical protein